MSEASLHQAILRSALPFPRRPSRTDDVRRLAVDTIRLIDHEPSLVHLVHPRRAHVDVKLRDLGRNVLPGDEMRGNRIACGISRLEVRVELAERELAIRYEGLLTCGLARNFGVGV